MAGPYRRSSFRTMSLLPDGRIDAAIRAVGVVRPVRSWKVDSEKEPPGRVRRCRCGVQGLVEDTAVSQGVVESRERGTRHDRPCERR